MTTLLKEALSRVRNLPEEEQNRAAEVLLALTRKRRAYTFTPKQIAGIKHAIKQSGAGIFANEKRVRKIFGRSL